ncbi:RNase A-like domain-containing protein [Brenneria goodwinii]|uniref:RNase A-like domain-containing protein n=1 Tax=Brenneria goodwinii TaxID=1109412 RepID=UPI0036E631F3
MESVLPVVMSPVQLAAVLSDKSVTEAETLSNRLLGGLGVALGAVELVGAGALCLVPEPTTLTKVGCVVVGTHSLDSINAAANQVITGRDTRTATYQSAVALAKQFGADDNTAWKVGLTVDIAVPTGFALAIGASRVIYVRAGSLKLAEHEAVGVVKAGGHTIAKHVGIPERELLARLAKSPKLQSASSFNNIRVAEQAVSATLKANRIKIIYWANITKASDPLELTYATGNVIGYGFRQGSKIKESVTTVRVVLLKKSYNGNPYYVLTAYPFMG